MKQTLVTLLAAFSLFALSSCRDHLTGPPSTPVSSDTIANWTFNSNLKDVTGNGHDGTQPQVFFDSNRFGQASSAIAMHGALQNSDPITVSNVSHLNFTDSDSYTISVWVKPSAWWYLNMLPMAQVGGLVCKGNSADTSYPGYQLLLHADVAEVKISAVAGNIDLWGKTSVADGKWHLLTLVVSAHSSVSLYTDSILDGSISNNGMTPDFQNNGPLVIGADPTMLENFNGDLDDILICHHAFSSSEVAARFHEGGWYEHVHDTITLPPPPPPVPDTGWKQVQNFPDPSAAIEGICFPRPEIAYACGGTEIFKSTDSGKTWVTQSNPSTQTLYRISFKDAMNGIVGGNGGTLFMTTDGGVTWNQNTNIGLTSGQNIRDLVYTPDGYMVVTGGTGPVPSPGFISTSVDNGTTWSQTTTGESIYGVKALGNHTNFITAGSSGEIYLTNNLITWTQQTVQQSGNDLLSIDMYSDQYAFASSAEGKVFVSLDYGATWNLAYDNGNGHATRAVRIVNRTNIWAADDNGNISHITSNDGVNYGSDRRLNINNIQWNNIVQRDPHTLVFVGDNGTLYFYKF